MSSGHLRIGARYAGGPITGLQVSLERPPVTRLFPGMAPEQALATVPLLYALCSQAQGRAAAAALAAARETPLPEADPRPLWLEALHEHLWRLLLDWPAALGLEAPREAFAVWRKCRQATAPVFLAATNQLLDQALGLVPAATGLALRPDGLAARCLARLDTPVDALLDPEPEPPLDPAPWLRTWRDDGDAALETTAAIATPTTPGVAYVRRLAQVREAVRALAGRLPYPVDLAGGEARGVGLTRTARGPLVHGIRLDAEGQRIADYQVWAPTDLLFADAGPLTRQLENGAWPDARAARQALEAAILALDPCVPYTVDWLEN